MKHKTNNYFLIAIAIVSGLAVFKMFSPFIITLLISFILWQLFKKCFEFFKKVVKNAQIASFLTCILIALIVIIPIFIIGSIASKEALDIYGNISNNPSIVVGFEDKMKLWVVQQGNHFGLEEAKVNDYFTSINLNEVTNQVAGVTAGILQQVYTQLSWFIFLVFVMIFTLYYFFLDGEKFLRYLFRISPLPQRDDNTLFERFMSMSRATLRGSVIMGIIQGVLGGVAFFFLGIGSPVFWGLMMTFFSVIPLVGSAIIWLPMAIWLFVTGQVMSGLILVFVGTFVMGGFDNFLRPRLVGKNTAIHPVLILLGTLGGIVEFGAMGFIVGPIIISIFVTILEIFEKKIIQGDN